MFKYRVACAGCFKDIKYTDSSSRIQFIKENALKNDKKNDEKTLLKKQGHYLPDKNSTQHTLSRIRRGGASAPKKSSI
jgi:hypothetical protein